MVCKICSTNDIKHLDVLYDDRYGYPAKFDLCKCKNCGHKFIEHNLTNNDLINLYSNYYPRSNFKVEDYKQAEYNKNFHSWFNGQQSSAFTYVPENVKVLDIGCGFGQSLGYHKNRGCEVFGVEADYNAQRVAERFGFNIHNGLFDCTQYESDFFEYITLDQVLEHSVDPYTLLIDISKVLKREGKLVISVPNAKGWGSKVFKNKWINWHTPYHLQHFSKKSFFTLIEKTDCYKIDSIKTITPSDWLFYQMFHMVEFPKVGEKSNFWSKNIIKANKVSFIRKLLSKIINLSYRLKIFHLITRLFDSLNMGDNLIIILEKK